MEPKIINGDKMDKEEKRKSALKRLEDLAGFRLENLSAEEIEALADVLCGAVNIQNLYRTLSRRCQLWINQIVGLEENLKEKLVEWAEGNKWRKKRCH